MARIKLYIDNDFDTPDVLRELANAIENSEHEISDYESHNFCANIEWDD